MTDYSRFTGLRFEDFRKMALDPTLSQFEKIGFPDAYRAGFGDAIFADIRAKLTNLDANAQTVLDIGPGCSDLPRLLIDHCREREHQLLLADAPEMLDLLPDAPFVRRFPGYYPNDCPQLFSDYVGRIDVINAYSVLQIVFSEGDVYRFFDQSLSLLADGGQMLIGDILNTSKRRRFFASENGARFHQNFMQTEARPEVHFNTLASGQIDDAVLLSLVMRARVAGFDAYLLPQRADLPMANRREDLLICKP